MDFELVFSKCEHLSKEWILTGYEERLKESKFVVNESLTKYQLQPADEGVQLIEGVRLIEKLAVQVLGIVNLLLIRRM